MRQSRVDADCRCSRIASSASHRWIRRTVFPALLAAFVLALAAAGAPAATGPLVFEGGEPGVQHNPKIHIILFGGQSYWEGSEGVATRQTLEGFYPALSGSSWQGILTQYYDYATHPSQYLSLAPTYVSTYSPYTVLDYNTVPLIARDAINKQIEAGKWGEVTPDSQYVVVASLESTYNTGFLSGSCAWHSWDYLKGSEGTRFNFTFLFNYKNAAIHEKCSLYESDPLRIMTTLASHEYAETVTDPLPTGSGTIKRGWVSHDPAPGGHTISDVCTGTEHVGQPGPNGYYVTPLWDNFKGGCVTSDPNPPFPSPEQPQPLVQASGKVNLFWRAANGALDYSSSGDGGKTWSNVSQLTSLGQPTAGQPTAVEPSAGRISVFWKSGQEDSGIVECFGPTDGYLREKEFNGSSWETKIPCVGGKQPIGPLGGPPEAIVQPNGTLKVFWRGTDNALWYASRTGGTWTAPTSLGGSLASNPSVVQAGSEFLHVFWKAPGDLLAHRAFNEATSTWGLTETAAGVMGAGSYAGPTAIARAGAGVEAVWPSSSGMRRTWYNGSYWPIEGIASGPVLPNPQFSAAAVPVGSGNGQLWYTGTDNQLWSSTYSGSGWSSSWVFYPSGTNVGTQPQAAVSPAGNPSVYWMDPNILGAYAAWNDGSAWHGTTLVSPLGPMAPSATTGQATTGGETTATLAGTLFAGRTKTNYSFQYGHTKSYGTSTSTSSSSESFPKEAKASISKLEPGTNYHFRLVAENSLGKSEGEDEAFTAGWGLQPVEGGYLAAISCASSSDCTAVGHSGTKPLISRWNGTSWQTETGKEPEAGEAQESVLTGVSCSSSIYCMAVGYYKSKAGKYLTWAERRSGSAWESVTTQNKSSSGEVFNFLEGVSCLSSSKCVAVGRYLTRTGPGESEVTKAMGEYSTGGSFTLQELPTIGGSTDTELTGVSCYATNECTAVGYYNSGPGQWRPMEGQWFGSSGWTAAALPIPAGASNGWLNGISCPTADYCAAAGMYSSPSLSFYPMALRRNGPKWTTWQAQTPPAPEGGAQGYLYGVSCPDKASCVAVGNYTIGGPFGVRTLAESWNGSSWGVQYPFNPSNRSKFSAIELAGVSCPRRGSCRGAGFYLNESSILSALADSYSIKVPPTVETTEATTVASDTATLNGTVNPNGVATTYSFEYGTTTAYGSTSSQGTTGAGETAISVSRAVSGLKPNTTYHFRIVATNGTGGNQLGEDRTFTTEPGWTIESAANPEEAKQAKLNGVQCPEDEFCAAVGEYETGWETTEPLAEEWPATSWQLMPFSEGEGKGALVLNGTACVEAYECVGVGDSSSEYGPKEAAVERWTGSEWQPEWIPLPETATESSLEGVSCTQAGICVAVGYYETSGAKLALIERWNGWEWELQTAPELAGTESAELSGVSCARWTLFGTHEECLAVGSNERYGVVEGLSERWAGSKWEASAVSGPGEFTRLQAASCPTPTASLVMTCEAVGYTGSPGYGQVIARKWTGFTWQTQSILGPEAEAEPQLTGVSCAAPSKCVAVGNYQSGEASLVFSETWKNEAWEMRTLPEPEGSESTTINGISCRPSGTCAAVGHYEESETTFPLAERYS